LKTFSNCKFYFRISAF